VYDYAESTDALAEVWERTNEAEEPKGSTRGRPRKTGASKLSDDVRLAIKVARANDAVLTQLAALVDVVDKTDIERVVAGAIKQQDDLKTSIQWLINAAKVKDPMELALEVSTLAIQDVDRLVAVASVISTIGEPVSVRRADVSRALLPVAQSIAGLTPANKKAMTEIVDLLGG